ncbi:hypothetical protein AG1IA_10202 [Rhizoctonia solani AG-1 IA]|uniref:Uncharacterized protein n=1 Tax=Thanatephorus cucumeris (strain AG1-IA) TaxID=983506 RepID=L8WG90_THACA|nr:hypothetical protein AG1IA_10202 [Rhizoctonia solani AG-1 IA]
MVGDKAYRYITAWAWFSLRRYAVRAGLVTGLKLRFPSSGPAPNRPGGQPRGSVLSRSYTHACVTMVCHEVTVNLWVTRIYNLVDSSAQLTLAQNATKRRDTQEILYNSYTLTIINGTTSRPYVSHLSSIADDHIP